MKPLTWLFSLVFLSSLSATAAGATYQAVVHVANGDCAGLNQALNLAAQTSAGTQTGSTGELIVLAKNGSYPDCVVYGPQATGAITIDGNGSTILLGQAADNFGGVGPLLFLSAHPFTIRNVTIQVGYDEIVGAHHGPAIGSALENFGDLILESSTILLAGTTGIVNSGNLVLRDVTITDAPGTAGNSGVWGVINTKYIGYTGFPGSVDIEQSTISVRGDQQFLSVLAGGNITVANSILVVGNQSNQGFCNAQQTGPSTSAPVSLGGNIFSDNSCGYNAATDHIVQDAGLADFGTHGGVVGTLALNFNSPARYAGLAANCTATDARGVARGSAHCDAGAYEFGGGYGQLAASGMSGAYYDAAHDGHYVTVQSLANGNAVVIWNTFNEKGQPAWVYGVGTVDGHTIHVANVSQNLGGVLQPGGVVTGNKETPWGTFDFAVSDCLNATLAYHSTNPFFGSGSVNLTRIAFVNGFDCSN